jgi:hypothetical protein
MRERKSSQVDYYESAEGVEISRERALEELKQHGIVTLDMLQDFDYQLGIKNWYDAQAVLRWLGY